MPNDVQVDLAFRPSGYTPIPRFGGSLAPLGLHSKWRFLRRKKGLQKIPLAMHMALNPHTLTVISRRLGVPGAPPDPAFTIPLGAVLNRKISRPLKTGMKRFLRSHKKVILVSHGRSWYRAGVVSKIYQDLMTAIGKKYIDGIIVARDCPSRIHLPNGKILFLDKQSWCFQMGGNGQSDVLLEESVKLLLTDGRSIDTFEAIACTKPMLVIPVYLEQHVNAYHLLLTGMALTLETVTLIKGEVTRSLRKIVVDMDSSFKKNSKNMSETLRECAKSGCNLVDLLQVAFPFSRSADRSFEGQPDHQSSPPRFRPVLTPLEVNAPWETPRNSWAMQELVQELEPYQRVSTPSSENTLHEPASPVSIGPAIREVASQLHWERSQTQGDTG